MTTKVTDNDVLALITDEPISQIEIGRKLAIHRSNVKPHLIRLEATGQVKQTSDKKWILAQAQSGSVLRTTPLSEKQLEFCRKLMNLDEVDDYWVIPDRRIDGSDYMLHAIMVNLQQMYPHNNLIQDFGWLMQYKMTHVIEGDEPDTERLDELINNVREDITEEYPDEDE